jgi:hypothetical protein
MATTVLKLKREIFTNKWTLGTLRFPDGAIFFTVEDFLPKYDYKNLKDSVAKLKVPGESAIPYGLYDLVVTMSPKFKRLMPRLLDVVGFDGILIHNGNTHEDTEGCILVGMSRSVHTGTVYQSFVAFNQVLKKIEDLYGQGPIKLKIE